MQVSRTLTRLSVFTIFLVGAMLLAGIAGAATFVTSGTFPVAGAAACTGEIVTGEGTFHQVTTTNVSPSGRVVMSTHLESLAQFTTASGQAYVGHGSTQEVQTYDLDFDSAAHNTTVVVARSILLGEQLSGDDLSLRMQVVYTVDPTGEIVEFHASFDFVCA